MPLGLRALHFFGQFPRFHVVVARKSKVLDFHFFALVDADVEAHGIDRFFVGKLLDLHFCVQKSFFHKMPPDGFGDFRFDVIGHDRALEEPLVDDTVEVIMLAFFHPFECVAGISRPLFDRDFEENDRPHCFFG